MSFGFEYSYEYYPLFSHLTATNPDSVSENIIVKVYPNWFTSINVSWKYPSDWGAVQTNVYHSPTQLGPFEKLNSTLIDSNTNLLADKTTQDFSKIREGWYIIEAVLADGKRIQSLPTTWRNTRSSWVEIRANEITRREWLLLRKFVGIDSYIFHRKMYGKRCDNCWSYKYEKVVKDKCEECYGTSFEGGYWTPVKSSVQYEPTPNETQLTYFGPFEVNELAAWTISYPDIDQRDLIYRPSDGKLFEVGDKKQTELQTVMVRQIFKLVELDKNCVEYKIVLANNLIPV